MKQIPNTIEEKIKGFREKFVIRNYAMDKNVVAWFDGEITRLHIAPDVEDFIRQALIDVSQEAEKKTIESVIADMEKRDDAGNYTLGMVYDAICHFKKKLSHLKEGEKE